jgi:hypothetical protein
MGRSPCDHRVPSPFPFLLASKENHGRVPTGNQVVRSKFTRCRPSIRSNSQMVSSGTTGSDIGRPGRKILDRADVFIERCACLEHGQKRTGPVRLNDQACAFLALLELSL